MDEQGMETRLKALAGEYFNGRGLEIVEFSCRADGRAFILRILADRPEGGISMDECAGANRELARIIDQAFEASGGIDYSLEVSSPGADRPLRTGGDFARCRGALVHFFLKEPVCGKIEPEGIVKQVCEECVEAEVGGETVKVPFGIINMAKQMLNRNRE